MTTDYPSALKELKVVSFFFVDDHLTMIIMTILLMSFLNKFEKFKIEKKF